MSESGPEAASGVDPGALARLRATLREQGDAVVSQLIDLFMSEGVKRLATIDDGLRRDDASSVQLCAHALRGSAELLGARRLAFLSHSLERAAGEGKLDTTAELVSDLHAEYECVERQLKAPA